MDLKRYYQKIREIESTVTDKFAVIVSLETADGGRAGTLTEVLPRVAAKMVADGVARLATQAEAQLLQVQQAEAQRQAEQLATVQRVQLSVLPTSELEKLRAAVQAPKE